MRSHLIHTSGDLILAMADGGRVRAYEVAADGGLTEQPPAVAFGLREARETATPEDGHRYSCCGKVGRISRHEAWCEQASTGREP